MGTSSLGEVPRLHRHRTIETASDAKSVQTTGRLLNNYFFDAGIAPMPLKVAPLEEPTINLTSLLDIILFLVMFFMIGAHFSEDERQTDIQIPGAMASTTLSGAPDAIVINIATDGQVTVKGEPQTLDALVELLIAARSEFPRQSVVIRGDGRCQYQQIMDALSVCTEAGIGNVAVAHLPRKRS